MYFLEWRLYFELNFGEIVQLTIRKHWFRYSCLDRRQAEFLNQWWPRLRTHICVNRPLWVKNLGRLYASMTVSLLEEVIAFLLLRPKPSSQPMLTYFQLNFWKNFQRNFNPNKICFYQDMHFENVAWKMLAIFFIQQCEIIVNAIVCSTVCSCVNQRKHQSSESLAFVNVSGVSTCGRGNVSIWWRHHETTTEIDHWIVIYTNVLS